MKNLTKAEKEKKLRSLIRRLKEAERLYDRSLDMANKYHKKIRILGSHINKYL
jgi:hypothetical protein